MTIQTDKPYDAAKHRWAMIAVFGAFFAVGSAIVKYGIAPHMGL